MNRWLCGVLAPRRRDRRGGCQTRTDRATPDGNARCELEPADGLLADAYAIVAGGSGDRGLDGGGRRAIREADAQFVVRRPAAAQVAEAGGPFDVAFSPATVHHSVRPSGPCRNRVACLGRSPANP